MPLNIAPSFMFQSELEMNPSWGFLEALEKTRWEKLTGYLDVLFHFTLERTISEPKWGQISGSVQSDWSEGITYAWESKSTPEDLVQMSTWAWLESVKAVEKFRNSLLREEPISMIGTVLLNLPVSTVQQSSECVSLQVCNGYLWQAVKRMKDHWCVSSNNEVKDKQDFQDFLDCNAFYSLSVFKYFNLFFSIPLWPLTVKANDIFVIMTPVSGWDILGSMLCKWLLQAEKKNPNSELHYLLTLKQ